MADESQFTMLSVPKDSGWQCFMFGNRPGGYGMAYRPAEGQVPNAFVRFMMRVCFDCTWVRDTPHVPPQEKQPQDGAA